jgi:hypothetical protein
MGKVDALGDLAPCNGQENSATSTLARLHVLFESDRSLESVLRFDKEEFVLD